jgi:hypothetical protein
MKIKEVIAEGLQDWLDDRKEKKEEKMLSQVRAGLPATALKQFQKELKESNIDINNPGQTDLTSLIQNFALNYFGVGDNKYQFQLEEKVAAVIKEKIAKIPLPSAVNVIAIKAYFTDANNARTAELNKLENSIRTRNLAAQPEPSPQTAQLTPASTQQPAANLQTAPARPVSAGGVTLFRSAGRDNAGQTTPTRVIYQNKQYALQDDDSWVDVKSGKPVNTTFASFLQQELESIS